MNQSTKITRQTLKKVVKECLIEILSEGISSNSFSSSDITVPRNVERKPSPALVQAIRSESKRNPIMADIFADTARTTLPQMLSERNESREHVSGRLEDVFGVETSSKWAELAFLDSNTKKR